MAEIHKNLEGSVESRSEKPALLYHGSAHKSLEELQPRSKSHRVEEGELLYATPDIAIASIFLVGGAYYGCGKFSDVSYAWIIAGRDEFTRNDKGGHIYVLPSESFEINQGRGLGNDEYASKEPVKFVDKIEYPSVIDAMIGNGVQVYFIDRDTHERIRTSKDHGYAIFRSLESENQRRGINIRELGGQSEKTVS